jgi:hypothetical protein
VLASARARVSAVTQNLGFEIEKAVVAYWTGFSEDETEFFIHEVLRHCGPEINNERLLAIVWHYFGDHTSDDVFRQIKEILEYGNVVANLWQPIHGYDPETGAVLLRHVKPKPGGETDVWISDATTERLARQARSAIERLSALRERLANRGRPSPSD